MIISAHSEIQLTDALQTLMRSQPFVGVRYEGRRFDYDSKMGFLAPMSLCARPRRDRRRLPQSLSKIGFYTPLIGGLKIAAEKDPFPSDTRFCGG